MPKHENIYLEKLLEYIKDMKSIFIYVSKDDEVDTHKIITFLIKKDYTVIVPKCNKESIIPIQVNDFSELREGCFGILEPTSINEFNKSEIECYIVPGTKFDLDCNRNGRGYGYFDKFLEDVQSKKLIIGLTEEKNIFEKIKVQPWDVPVDILISEKRVIKRK